MAEVLRTRLTINGQPATSPGGSAATPPPTQANPTTFGVAGEHPYGIFRGCTKLTVEQTGGGGSGAAGEVGNGGDSGGGGGYAKYTLVPPFFQSGGVLTVTIGAGGVDAEDGLGSLVVGTNPLVYVQSGGGSSAANGAAGGFVTTHAGSGLSFPTTTNGDDGAVHSGDTGATGGAAGGPAGGTGGAGGASGKAGGDGGAPGGGGGGGGKGTTNPGAGAPGRVVITAAF